MPKTRIAMTKEEALSALFELRDFLRMLIEVRDFLKMLIEKSDKIEWRPDFAES